MPNLRRKELGAAAKGSVQGVGEHYSTPRSRRSHGTVFTTSRSPASSAPSGSACDGKAVKREQKNALYKTNDGVWAESEAAAPAPRSPFDGRAERLKGHPQEREHSDGEAGARDRMPPPSGSEFLARWDRSRMAETLRGSVYESPITRSGTRPNSTKPSALTANGFDRFGSKIFGETLVSSAGRHI